MRRAVGIVVALVLFAVSLSPVLGQAIIGGGGGGSYTGGTTAIVIGPMSGTAIPLTVNNGTSTGSILLGQDNSARKAELVDGGNLYLYSNGDGGSTNTITPTATFWIGNRGGGTNSPYTTLGAASEYAHMGGTEYGASANYGLGFGFYNSTGSPVWIGHAQASQSGQTAGDFLVAVRDSTSAAAPTMRERMVGLALSLTNNTASSVVAFTLSSGSVAGANIDYCVEATNGTDYQEVCGIVSSACVNKAATITSNASILGTESRITSAGTMTTSWGYSAGTCTLQMTANSSLASLTAGYPRIRYNIRYHGNQAVTPQ